MKTDTYAKGITKKLAALGLTVDDFEVSYTFHIKDSEGNYAKVTESELVYSSFDRNTDISISEVFE